MFTLLVVIAALVNIAARNNNYNINIAKNPDFDIRVRRDVNMDAVKTPKSGFLTKILNNVDETSDQSKESFAVNPEATDSYEDRVSKNIKDLSPPNTFIRDIHEAIDRNVKNGFLAKTTKEEPDIGILNNPTDKEFVQVIPEENKQSKNPKYVHNKKDLHLRIGKNFKGINIFDIIARYSENPKQVYYTKIANPENNEPLKAEFDKYTKTKLEDHLNIVNIKNASKIFDAGNNILKTIIYFLHNKKTNNDRKNRNKFLQRNIKIKRNASPDTGISSFFTGIYNKVYNLTHPNQGGAGDDNHEEDNFQVTKSYDYDNYLNQQNQFNNFNNNERPNDIQVSNNNYNSYNGINNQPYQDQHNRALYNSFDNRNNYQRYNNNNNLQVSNVNFDDYNRLYNNQNQLSGNNFNNQDYRYGNTYSQNYQYGNNRNNLTYSSYAINNNNVYPSYPMPTRNNVSYSSNNYSAQNNRDYYYNYGYSPYNNNGLTNLPKSDTNTNYYNTNGYSGYGYSGTNSGYGYNSSVVSDFNTVNSTTTDGPIVQVCVFCGSFGCPYNYRRAGFICVPIK